MSLLLKKSPLSAPFSGRAIAQFFRQIILTLT